MNEVNTVKQANEITGGLSNPEKMPCFAYSITARKCITGMKLRDVAGSICSKCYALKNRYAFGNVQAALHRRFEALKNKLWVTAMVFLIGKKEKSGFFRWHDSGDLQSVEHLANIAAIATALPSIKFWLPTREFSIVGQYLNEHGPLPENLTVRLSALMIDGAPPAAIAKRFGMVTSGVTKDGFTCPAPNQGNKCLDCRACWNKKVDNVNYHLH
jgi:hypothetical protein